jgi:peptidoglycan/LPS O-acetylase OafA/YrhL
MFRAFWVSLAQVAAAVLVAVACLVASSVAARGSDPYDETWEGFEYLVAGLVLVPLGAMIAGSLVARRLRLANWASYSLSVIAVIVIMSLGSGLLFGIVPLAVLILTGANLLIAYTTGLRLTDRGIPDRRRPDHHAEGGPDPS